MLRGIPTFGSNDGATKREAGMTECSKNANIVSLITEGDDDVL
jgi:hypothetical protein